MAIIPLDVLYSCIFPRLPVKSLTRFKSVSKSWRTIISSPEFIHLHHHNANRLIVFVHCSLQEFHIQELDSPLSPSVHWYNPERGPKSMSILASCEFFLLIDFYGNLGLALLNPSTGIYYQIPYPPSDNNYSECYGIYLDEDNHDYKVFRITQKCCTWGYEDVEINIQVYSLRTNEWRLIDRRLEKCYAWCSAIAVIGHSLHIVFSLHKNDFIQRIGCFDILAEKWTDDVPMPQIIVLGLARLTVLDGLLCVITADSIWVMKEYGVKDSWFKLMSITSNNIWDWTHITPIAFRKGSQDEVLCTTHRNFMLEYIWYNVREKKATRATIKGIHGYICKGSLVDFPGGRSLKLHHTLNKRKKLARSSENYLFL